MVRYVKEDLELCVVFDFTGDEIGTPYQQTRFMTGMGTRNIENPKVHNVYLLVVYSSKLTLCELMSVRKRSDIGQIKGDFRNPSNTY